MRQTKPTRTSAVVSHRFYVFDVFAYFAHIDRLGCLVTGVRCLRKRPMMLQLFSSLLISFSAQAGPQEIPKMHKLSCHCKSFLVIGSLSPSRSPSPRLPGLRRQKASADSTPRFGSSFLNRPLDDPFSGPRGRTMQSSFAKGNGGKLAG